MLILLALAAHADDPADRPYNPIGKRDPFRSFLGPICTGGGCVQRTGPPVESLQLVGVLWGTDDPQALVVGPDGKSTLLSVGSYVGDSWGRVTAITDRTVEITEEYLDVEGRLVVIPTTLRLP